MRIACWLRLSYTANSSLLATRYSLLATRYSLLATRYATRYSLLATSSSGCLRKPAFPNHRYLDRARILQFGLDAFAQLLRDFARTIVGHLVWRYHHSDFPPGLNRERLLHPLERQCEFLQPAQPLNITRHRFRSRPGPHRGNRVRQNHQTGINRLRLHFLVMRRDRVHHDGRFTITFDKLRADHRVTALEFTRHAFADVVKKSGAFCDVGIESDLARNQ